ncbi:MAG: Holliday junction resolvase RuvX [Candidatus Kerfeldbacteria bacterium]|nr:Holliday junction resolvase RuvX [Candidatus Kerfeldbacteria bacterium]
MKVLAIDYGQKRVGLALGDSSLFLALPYGVLQRQNDELLLEQLSKIVSAEGVDTVIVGEPLSLSGQASKQTATCRAFAEFLKTNLSVAVEMFDERLTSKRADMPRSAARVRSRDELAAMFLLQDYLDLKARNK